jgi:triacylglycerol lipase
MTSRNPFREDQAQANVPLWKEARFPAEVVSLRFSPVFHGVGVPRGDGSGVILIPGFLLGDLHLTELAHWLKRIGYRPYLSGIKFNADCPNILIQRRLRATLDQARRQTGDKAHLIGHSLGGVMARAIASQRPDDVASVITLASPFRGTVAHRSVLIAVEAVRRRILRKHGPEVLPECFTGHCLCPFLDALRRDLPASVAETAIYTSTDGVVDWRYCITGDSDSDFEVPGTHLGLAFNPKAYSIIAERLSQSRPPKMSLGVGPLDATSPPLGIGR